MWRMEKSKRTVNFAMIFMYIIFWTFFIVKIILYFCVLLFLTFIIFYITFWLLLAVLNLRLTQTYLYYLKNKENPIYPSFFYIIKLFYTFVWYLYQQFLLSDYIKCIRIFFIINKSVPGASWYLIKLQYYSV